MNLVVSLRTGAAALLVGAAALVGVTLSGAPAAQAASCPGAGGVTVVVDYGSLGGGVTAGCAPSGGDQRASSVFEQAGYPLSWATRDAGFVCRVSGLPANDPCTDAAQADQYWSLWWADGKGGGWVYSSRGAGSLRAPEGGYVAFRYHTGGGRATPPAAAATSRVTRPTSSPTPKPSSKPTRKPSATPRPGQPTRPGGTGQASSGGSTATGQTSQAPVQQTEFATGAPTASASSIGTPSPSSTSATPSASSTPSTASSTPTSNASSATASEVPAADAISAGPLDSTHVAAEKNDGLPVWVPIVVVVALIGAAGVVAARRRAH